MYDCYKVVMDIKEYDIPKIKTCGGYLMSEPKDYKIRDKVFILKLFKYGDGEPPAHESIIWANSEEDARGYYHKYKSELPEHKAYAIGLPKE